MPVAGMRSGSKSPRPGAANGKILDKPPTTPQPRRNSYLGVPILSPMPIYRLSPALDEFSLRRTPSRGGTASPAPAKGVRKRLHQYRNFGHAVDLLKRSNNIVILTGAGISTSVGIPDFRSDKGLYSQLSKDLGITEAEEFFSREYFVQNTEQFFHYVKRVIPEAIIGADGFFKSTNSARDTKDGTVAVPKFSPTHAFLALLFSMGKLLTNYTQNIDGLEVAAGVPHDKFVQCHGSWDTASCMTCGRTSAAKKYLPVVFDGNVPFCRCKLEAEQKSLKKNKKRANKKRSWDDFDSDHSSDDGTQAPRGLLKPDITFFNERLSASYGDRLNQDKRQIDLLIIIGTSLKVGPVQDMLYQISPKVPQIFISKERFSGALCNLPGVQVDIELLGECDIIIEELCRRAGWLDELKSLCWERGQRRIKNIDKREVDAQSDTRSVDSDSKQDIAGRKLVQGARPSKKLKVYNDEMNEAESKPSSQKDNADPISSIQQTETATKIIRGDTQYTSAPISNEHDSRPQAPIAQHTTLKVSRMEIVTTVDKVGTKPQSTPVIEPTGSQVKIELVEGTTHQWRVSRKQ